MSRLSLEGLTGFLATETAPVAPTRQQADPAASASFDEHLQRAQSAVPAPDRAPSAGPSSAAESAVSPRDREAAAGSPPSADDDAVAPKTGNEDDEPGGQDDGASEGQTSAPAAQATDRTALPDKTEDAGADSTATATLQANEPPAKVAAAAGGGGEPGASGKPRRSAPTETSAGLEADPTEAAAAIPEDRAAQAEGPAETPASPRGLAAKAARSAAQQSAAAKAEAPDNGEAAVDIPVAPEGTADGRPAGGASPEARGEAEPRGAGARRASGRSGAKAATAQPAPEAPGQPAAGSPTGANREAPSAGAATTVPAIETAATADANDGAAGSPRERARPIETARAEPLLQRRAAEDARPTPTDPTREPKAFDQADRVRFVQRVARAFEAAADRGSPLRMRLHPPELGSLRVEVTVRNGALSARLEAETDAARTALLDNLPALRERLAEHNLRIERFEVGWSGQSSGGLPQRPGEQTDGHPRRGGPTPAAIEPRRAAERSPLPRAARIGGNSTIDVIV